MFKKSKLHLHVKCGNNLLINKIIIIQNFSYLGTCIPVTVTQYIHIHVPRYFARKNNMCNIYIYIYIAVI